MRQGHFFPVGPPPVCTSENCSQRPFFTIAHQCQHFSLEPVIGGLTLVSMGPAWVGAPLVLLEGLQEAAVRRCKPSRGLPVGSGDLPRWRQDSNPYPGLCHLSLPLGPALAYSFCVSLLGTPPPLPISSCAFTRLEVLTMATIFILPTTCRLEGCSLAPPVFSPSPHGTVAVHICLFSVAGDHTWRVC